MSKGDNTQQWRDIQYVLDYTFGKNFVSSDENTIRVKFDHRSPAQQHLFYILTGMVGESFIEDSTHNASRNDNKLWIPDENHNPEICLRIPKDQDAEEFLNKLRFFTNQSRRGNKIVFRPETDVFIDDLSQLTGRPWQIVVGSKYGKPVLEPVLDERPSDELRQEQEMALGEATIPDFAHVKTTNWLEEQRAREQATGSGVRTSMPTDLLVADDPNVRAKLSSARYKSKYTEKLTALYNEGQKH